MNVTELIGKRALLKLGNGGSFMRSTSIDEFKFLEVSPSGNWVKLMNMHGNKFWRAVTDVSLVETLKDLKADKPES